MTKSSFSNRASSDESASSFLGGSREGQESSASPLPADEIESLLRSARDGGTSAGDFARHEELGPGDVQHLRGASSKQFIGENEPTLPVHWPDPSSSPDALLQHVEENLVRAIAGSDGGHVEASFPLPPLTMNSKKSSSGAAPAASMTLEDLGDLDLDITIELGRAEMAIEDVMKLREGSVVSLDKFAGDPVDIFANGRLVARGELIVVRGKFGVRLSEVL